MAVVIAALGPVCDPTGIRVTPRPPDPVLVDARGEVDPSGVDALIAAIEAERGLRFIQRPTLELLSVDDARLASLAAAAQALEACPSATSASEASTGFAGACFPAPSLEWIECVAPVDLEQARRALRRLLDAQNHPRLARMAPTLRGDPGVAVRALLAASANGAGPGPAAGGEDPVDLFELGDIDVERDAAPEGACVAIATHFLSMQQDREAPFRRPPLSTKQLVSPKRYRAAERPMLLVGAPPVVSGCSVASDESIGVARLIVAALAKDKSVPGPLLGAWMGDRGLRFACDEAGERWIYVAELSSPAQAAAFAKKIQRMLPGVFGGRSAAHAVQSRAVVNSRGIDADAARAWAAALVAREIVDLQELD